MTLFGGGLPPPHMVEGLTRHFSIFAPVGAFGQTTGQAFVLGHLWGTIFMAPQGPAMATVPKRCNVALDSSRRGGTLVVCCSSREALSMGFDPVETVGGVVADVCTLYQLLRFWKMKRAPKKKKESILFFLKHSESTPNRARLEIRTALGHALHQFVASQNSEEASAEEEAGAEAVPSSHPQDSAPHHGPVQAGSHGVVPLATGGGAGRSLE